MRNGFSLIELLVILVIVGILSFVGISQLTPKSTRAVKSGLQEVSAAFKQARGLAMVGGKEVDFVFSTASPARLQVFDYQVAADGTKTLNTVPLMDVAFGKSWQQNATFFTTADGTPPFGAGVESFMGKTTLLTNLGLTGTQWGTALLAGTSKQGFSPAGTPQTITGSGATSVRNVEPNGLWVGISGTTPNGQGYPYGYILITGRGTIQTYYKSDSSQSGATTPEAAWKRLE